MFGFSLPALIVVLLIVLVIFGAGRIPEIGAALGKSIKNFKSATDEKDEIDGSAKKKDDGKKED